MAVAGLAAGETETVSPMAKILQLMSDMQTKIIQEGEQAQKAYAEYAEWCEDRSRDLNFALKNSKSTAENLQASIEEATATISSRTAKVEELASSLSSDQAELKAAQEVREKEAKDFAIAEKELVETVSMLKRASAIIEREMKGGAAMLQLQQADNVVAALKTMVEASLIQSSDASKLSSLLQQESDEEDASAGAPAADAYESHSGVVLDTLGDLQDKAESQLDDLRQKETNSLHNFEMLKQSLEDQIKVSQKEMDRAKKDIAVSSEAKSTAEGDLEVTKKDLAATTEAKGTLHHECMSKASDFEAETKSRGEELQAIATAKKVLKETSGDTALDQLSFVQVRARATSSSFEAVRMVRSLAHKHGSAALAALATRISSEMEAGGPFDKVKGMISDMIAKLQDEADADATKKAWCDKELAETNGKVDDKSAELEAQTTKIESSTAKSAQLQEELAALQKEISALIKSQAQMDKIRAEEKATYQATKAELERSLEGVKAALKILNDYYGSSGGAHQKQGGSAGVIGLLEVVESDLSKNLAGITAEEESAAANYDTQTKENEVEKASMEQDVKYKSKESKELDKTATELKADRVSTQEEFDAVTEYNAKIKSECTGKAETYEETTRRRTAEIEGLKQALEVLAAEPALIQRGTTHRVRRALRGNGAVLSMSS